MKILFLGDVALNGIWSKVSKPVFDPKVIDLLSLHDFVLCNLECTIKSELGENFKKIPRIFTYSEAISQLKKYNINFCNLSNNHIYDNLDDGIEQTVECLIENKIRFSGILDKKKLNRNISILSYVDKSTHPCLPNKENKLYPKIFNLERAINEIKIEKNNNRFVIVSLHWGKSFRLLPEYNQRLIARKIVDAGADFIWGHHPHIIQKYEFINNTPVLYSMGNTCFDDIEDFNFYWNKENLKSLACSIEIKNNKINNFKLLHLDRKSPQSSAYIDQRQLLRTIPSIANKLIIYRIYYFGYFLIYLNRRVYRYFFGKNRSVIEQFYKIFKKIF